MFRLLLLGHIGVRIRCFRPPAALDEDISRERRAHLFTSLTEEQLGNRRKMIHVHDVASAVAGDLIVHTLPLAGLLVEVHNPALVRVRSRSWDGHRDIRREFVPSRTEGKVIADHPLGGGLVGLLRKRPHDQLVGTALQVPPEKVGADAVIKLHRGRLLRYRGSIFRGGRDLLFAVANRDKLRISGTVIIRYLRCRSLVCRKGIVFSVQADCNGLPVLRSGQTAVSAVPGDLPGRTPPVRDSHRAALVVNPGNPRSEDGIRPAFPEKSRLTEACVEEFYDHDYRKDKTKPAALLLSG